MLEILRFCDVENVQKNTANLISDCLLSLLSTQSQAVMAICGGRSVSGVFNYLADKNLPWDRIHIFMADERCVSIDDPDSNFKLAYDTFLEKMVADGKISKNNIHPFIFEGDISQDLEKYNNTIKAYGGSFDVVLLSIGEDGHIASLFPYHRSVKDIQSQLYIAVDDSPKPPSNRISASQNMIKRSKCSFLLATGESKRNALMAIDDEVYNEEDCPAKLVKHIPCSYLLTDQEDILL